MSWRDEVEELERRRALGEAQGGAEAVERQHARGRFTVRERIAALADKDSFREYGSNAGAAEVDDTGRLESFTPTNLVMGTARLDGRPVILGGDDFTIRGGAYGAAGLKKGQFADALAVRRKLPLVRLLEGGGASVSGSYSQRGRSGYDLTSPSPMNLLAMEALASVPVVCAALGPCAGFPAGRLVASHFSVMTRGTAQVLTGGPALVERALGERLDKEALGGADVHLRSGVVDNGADDEEEVWRLLRGFLSYLPPNVWETAPRIESSDPPGREDAELLDALPRNPRRAYKIRPLIERIVDRGSFFELTAQFGRSQVTGFARISGQPVGVLANDCTRDGGAMTADSARKIRRFVETCDTFHLPIVSFVDEPGFMIGAEAEKAGTIRHGMEALFAVQQTQVPWLAVVLRKSYGVAQGIHYGPGCTVIAWPSMMSGALPVESGVALAFGREIESAPDPAARRRELEAEMAEAHSVFPRAEDFGVHELIDPRHTRPVLCDWVEEIQTALVGHRGPRGYALRP